MQKGIASVGQDLVSDLDITVTDPPVKDCVSVVEPRNAERRVVTEEMEAVRVGPTPKLRRMNVCVSV